MPSEQKLAAEPIAAWALQWPATPVACTDLNGEKMLYYI
jgi:hypothetical protein